MKSADLAKLNVRLEKGLLVEENINSSLLLHGGRDVKRLDMRLGDMTWVGRNLSIRLKQSNMVSVCESIGV